MIGFIDNAFAHSRTVLTTLLLILIAGTVAYIEVPKEADPDINIPIVYVQMNHDGISPEDAERLLIRPMEQEMRGIEGVKEMRAKGYEGGASVTLEFDAGFNADVAMDDVREKVELAKADLPDETDEPTVHEINLSLFPVILVTLSGDVPERTLLRVARDMKDAVEGISTVLEVKIAGDREEMVEVLIDPVRVESYGLSPEQAIQLVASSNLLVAAGAQDTGHGRFSLKVPGLLETTEDIMSLPIRADGDAVITLKDVAEIRRTFKDAESFARIDGRTALVLEVTNTPWGQNQVYVLPGDPSKKIQRINFQKEMHVSPFYEMDMTYKLRCHKPDNKLSMQLENHQNNEKQFDATLTLEKEALTGKNLNSILWRYPAMTMKVFAGIYWQALKLWVKGVPFISNPHISRREQNASK